MAQQRLLGVFAHPDDESFGPGATLARYAREGVQVHVCTVTDGGAGGQSESVAGQGDSALIQQRLEELLCACRVLGAEPHTRQHGWRRGYADSGMAGSPENQNPASLYQADLDDVALDMVRVMRQVRPHVIITHDPSGGYSHPDHIKVNRAVVRAMEDVNDASVCPELAPWMPDRLYYTAVPRSWLKWFIWLLRLAGRDPSRFGQNADIDLTRIGVPDDEIHVKLDVGAYLPIKEEASACHRSQGGGTMLRSVLPGFLRRRIMRYEHYVQAWPQGAQRHDSLFEGLAVED